MQPALVFERFVLDALTLCEDALGSPEVDIGRGQIVETLMVAGVIVMLDERAYLPFKIAGQVGVVEQDAVLQGLMSALDLPLCLRMRRRTPHMLHGLLLAPFGQITRDVR